MMLSTGEETHYKGCSAFGHTENEEDDDAKCAEAEFDGTKLIACKSLCTSDDYCNTLSVQGGGLMCYGCEVTFNQMGQMMGWGDMACYDSLAERHLQLGCFLSVLKIFLILC